MPFVPNLSYRDAPAALTWLQEAFGLELLFQVPGPSGGVVHAQLRLGGGIVMVSSARDGHLLVHPADAGGSTSGIYVVLPSTIDVDAHFARATAAGATVVMAPTDQEYGGRDYSCTDCEGHFWSFGTYDPFTPAG